VVFAGAIWLSSFPYFFNREGKSIAYLAGRESYVEGLFSVGLFWHAMLSPLALGLGTLQIFYPRNFAHKFVGSCYILLVLISVSGAIILAYYSYGGIWIKANLFALIFFWIVFTGYGVKYLLLQQWVKHRQFMLRSCALTFSAILLRVFSYLGEEVFHINNQSGYPVYVIINWLPLIIGIEIYLRYSNSKKPSNACAKVC
jgi:hypothetical protein